MRTFSVNNTNRREFLRLFAGVAASPLVGAVSELACAAGPYNDYRALVCVFLFGGNDAHNMIVPLDGRYATYATNRGPLALPQASLQGNAVTDPTQGSFGFHPRMTRTGELFRAGKLAVVSNVGILVRPTTKFDYQNRSQLPPQLFSHNDMQGHWFTIHPQAPATTGWGGRLADLIRSANIGQLPVSVAAAASDIFLKGADTSAYRVRPFDPSATMVQRIQAYRAWDRLVNVDAVYDEMITMARTNILEDQYSDIATTSKDVNDFVINSVYAGPDSNGKYTEKVPINTAFPSGEPLAAQLRSVATMIAARQALGVKRQIFFVSLGGFDTHSDQLDAGTSTLKPGPNDPAILFGNHADLLGKVDAALKAFYDATVELGVANNVTTFTASDFGRSLTSNGLGCDHGWGAHHLVMGGAVKGGKIYGTFHNMQIGTGNPADAGQGRLIPDISADQYAGTMAKWMGANAADLNVVFPNLQNFGVNDLGFLG